MIWYGFFVDTGKLHAAYVPLTFFDTASDMTKSCKSNKTLTSDKMLLIRLERLIDNS